MTAFTNMSQWVSRVLSYVVYLSLVFIFGLFVPKQYYLLLSLLLFRFFLLKRLILCWICLYRSISCTSTFGKDLVIREQTVSPFFLLYMITFVLMTLHSLLMCQLFYLHKYREANRKRCQRIIWYFFHIHINGLI